MMQASPATIFCYQRAARTLARRGHHFTKASVLWDEACARLSERLNESTRDFPHTLCLAPYAPSLPEALLHTGKCSTVHTLGWYRSLPADSYAHPEHVPVGEASVDAAVCGLALSAINDVPGVFTQLHRALKPDSMVLISLLGGDTLRELREVFAEVETVRSGGISPRVHPFVDVREAGNLLQRTGFNLPVVDRDIITVTYPDLFALMHELRMLSATNMLRAQRSNFTSRGFFIDAAKRYAERYGNDDGTINATLEIITLIGWKPHSSQPKPLARGSAKHSLADALK